MDGDVPQKESIQDFAKRLKTKYPEYQDKEDGDLVERYVRKNPVYAERIYLPDNFSLLGQATTSYQKLDKVYEDAGRANNVNPQLLLEQGRQETIGFKPDVMYGRQNSPVGARGAGQFMAGTAPKYGLTVNSKQDDRTDPIKSIHAQAKYMRKLLDQFDGNEDLALAGYNAGEYRDSLKRGEIPSIPETQNYVKTIKGHLAKHRAGTSTLSAFLAQAASSQPSPSIAQPMAGQAAPQADNALPEGWQAEPDPAYMAQNFGAGSPSSTINLPPEMLPEKAAALPTLDANALPVPSNIAQPYAQFVQDYKLQDSPQLRSMYAERWQKAKETGGNPFTQEEVDQLAEHGGLIAPGEANRPVGTETPSQTEQAATTQTAPIQSGTPSSAKKDDALRAPIFEAKIDFKKKPADMSNQEYAFRSAVKQAQPKYGYSNSDIERVVEKARKGDGISFTEQTPEQIDQITATGEAIPMTLHENTLRQLQHENSTDANIEERQIKEMANPGDDAIREAVAREKAPIPTLDNAELGGYEPANLAIKGYNWFTDRNGEVTDKDVENYRQNLPSEEQVRSAFEGTKNFNKLLGHNATGLLGGLAGGAGRFLDALNGVTKLAGIGFLGDGLKTMTGGKVDINKAMKTPGQDLALIQGVSRQGDDSYMMDLGQGIAGAAFDVPRFLLISKIPGLGGAVGTFGMDNFLQSVGKGESLEKNAIEGGKGALLGAVFHGAGKAGELAGGLTSKIAPDVLATAVKEGVTIASIGGGTYAAEKLTGATDQDAMRAAVGLTAFHLANKIPEAVGKVFKFVKDGNELTATITDKGEVKEIELPKGETPDGVIDISKVSPDEFAKLGKQYLKKDTEVAAKPDLQAKAGKVIESPEIAQSSVELPAVKAENIKKSAVPEAPSAKVADEVAEKPQGDGVSKIGKSLSQKAIDKGLTDTFGDSATYDKITIADQSKKMAEMLKDPERINRIISGEERLPDDIRGGSFIKSVEDNALANGDAETLAKLASSSITSETSRHAQELRTLAERDPDSVTAKLSAIKNARIVAAEKRLPKNQTLNDAVKSETESIKSEIKKSVPRKEAWSRFLDEIVCR